MSQKLQNLIVELAQALDRLDKKLTGKISSNIRPLPKCVSQWLETEIYLSDGGYSRIVFSQMDSDEGSLFLTSNSIPSTKARWEEAGAQRQRVEALFRRLLDLAED